MRILPLRHINLQTFFAQNYKMDFLLGHVLCDKINDYTCRSVRHINFAYTVHLKENILTFILYFFLNKCEKNVKGGIHATQDPLNKGIMPTKAYIIKG